MPEQQEAQPINVKKTLQFVEPVGEVEFEIYIGTTRLREMIEDQGVSMSCCRTTG